jgi:integrase
MRRHMEADAITFKPFAQGAAKVAVAKGVPAARTPIPPPRLALYLFEQSARWVFDRSDPLSIRLSQSRADHNDSSLHRDITLMATACWILIAAFSARRDREVDELEAGCLAGNDADGWWIETYIEKTLQRKDWIPVPSIVARAVATLLKISAPARELMGNRQIFQYVAQIGGKAVALDVGRHLDDFAAAVGVPLYEPRGKAPRAWHWTPHQIRRFFAILYFHRYEGASLETLSHHLRHFNLEMTRRYVTQDKEVASLWLDIEWGYTGHVARSIVTGERAVGGAMGDCI